MFSFRLQTYLNYSIKIKNMNNKATKSLQLAHNIAQARKTKGLSQNDLASMLDISREHLAKIETNKRGISIGLLFELCDKLDIKEADLFYFK